MRKTTSSHTKNATGADSSHRVITKGDQLLKQKKYKKVLTLCRRHLANMPNDTQILNLAGTAAYHDGKLPVAIDFFRQAIRTAPENYLPHFNLANTLNRAGNTHDAIAAYGNALRLSPNNQNILTSLGKLYDSIGDKPAAKRTYERLLNINPDSQEALQYLEPFYKNFLKDNPTHIATHKNLGIVLMQNNKPDEALNHFLRANELSPDDFDITVNLARLYFILGKLKDSEHMYRIAVRLSPDLAPLHQSLGTVQISLGKTDEAVASFRNAVRIDPQYTVAHEQLAYIIRHVDHDEDIRTMEKILKHSTLNTLQKSQLNFGLGKAYEDLKEYDKAFNHYAAANNLKRSLIKYNLADDRRFFENIIMHLFDKRLFEKFDNCGEPDNKPIFIIGMPRSGTTLVEQILSSHPDIHGAGEIGLLSDTINTYFNLQLKRPFPKGIEKLNCKIFAELGTQYSKILSQYDQNARYIINKMPHNFLYVGMIHLILPRAKIIHCIRDPLDTCFSCYAMSFRQGHDYSYQLDELGEYYGLYRKLMQHWQKQQRIDVVNVSYEALVNDLEAQTRRLLDACGLTWNDACLHFHKSDRPVRTASAGQVRNEIHDQSIQRWKHFERYLTPLIDSLNRALPDEKNGV